MPETNAYVTEAELRDRLGDTGDRLDSSLLVRACNVASRAVDRYCGRRFWRDAAATTRLFTVDDPTVAWVDDFSPDTGDAGLTIATDDAGDGTYSTTWTTGDYQLEPLNGNVVAAGDTATPWAYWRIVAVGRSGLAARVFPYSDRRAVLSVTTRFGWSAVPDDVAEASALLGARLFRRKDVPFGIASFGEGGAVRIGRSDGDVAALLAPYVLNRPRTLTYSPQRNSLFHGVQWAR